jgi:hypothetical protein
MCLFIYYSVQTARYASEDGFEVIAKLASWCKWLAKAVELRQAAWVESRGKICAQEKVSIKTRETPPGRKPK